LVMPIDAAVPCNTSTRSGQSGCSPAGRLDSVCSQQRNRRWSCVSGRHGTPSHCVPDYERWHACCADVTWSASAGRRVSLSDQLADELDIASIRCNHCAEHALTKEWPDDETECPHCHENGIEKGTHWNA